MDKSTTFSSLEASSLSPLFEAEARFPFVNPLMCLVKKTAQHNVCYPTGWWANPVHHGFNLGEPGS